MVVAAATAGVKSQDNESLVVSNNTRMHISVALAKMVDSFGLVFGLNDIGYLVIGLFIVCMAFLSGIISNNINNASDLSLPTAIMSFVHVHCQ